MKISSRSATIAILLGLSATALPAPLSTETGNAGSERAAVKAHRGRIRALRVETTRAQQAITVSVTPTLKSAEPLPQQFIVKRNLKKHTRNSK